MGVLYHDNVKKGLFSQSLMDIHISPVAVRSEDEESLFLVDHNGRKVRRDEEILSISPEDVFYGLYDSLRGDSLELDIYRMVLTGCSWFHGSSIDSRVLSDPSRVDMRFRELVCDRRRYWKGDVYKDSHEIGLFGIYSIFLVKEEETVHKG